MHIISLKSSKQKIVLLLLVFAIISFTTLFAHAYYPDGGSIVNPGTAGSGAGALSDSGCPSCTTSGLTGTNTGFGVPSPISATMSGGSSYGQGSYGGGVVKASYSQGSYSSGGGGGGNGIGTTWNSQTGSWEGGGQDGGGGNGGGSSAPLCPGGYTYYNGSCYPDAWCTQTASGGKGGTVTTCSVPQPPANCTAGSVTINNGSSQTLFNALQVPYNQTCASQNRTCSNGTLSGDASYIYSTCTVLEAPAMTGIYINAKPPLVRYGDSTTIYWNGGNSESCTVNGPGLSTSGITGTSMVNNIIGESKFVLKCTLGPSIHSATTTVKILPKIQET